MSVDILNIGTICFSTLVDSLALNWKDMEKVSKYLADNAHRILDLKFALISIDLKWNPSLKFLIFRNCELRKSNFSRF